MEAGVPLHTSAEVPKRRRLEEGTSNPVANMKMNGAVGSLGAGIARQTNAASSSSGSFAVKGGRAPLARLMMRHVWMSRMALGVACMR